MAGQSAHGHKEYNMVLFRRLPIHLAMLACFGSMHAQAAETRVFVPVADTVIYFDGDAGTLTSGASNALGVSLSVGVDAGGTVRRSLLRFDLTSILPGSVVHSAELQLFETRSRANYDVSLHRVLAGWGEGSSNGGSAGDNGTASAGDATWLRAVFPGTAWSTAGGDFVQDDSATTLVGFAPGHYGWSSAGMVSDVQSWVNAPAGNHGWIMIGDETVDTNAKLFGSRESGVMPTLTLQVSPVPEPSMVATLLAGIGLIGWRLRSRSGTGRR
jgi:PEP-CTERM motif